MLADGVEASVRSLSSARRADDPGDGRRIIDERLDDGQFDECDLTLRDLERIREAFVAQLLGMYHQRIAYPENKVVELEARRTAVRPGRLTAAAVRPTGALRDRPPGAAGVRVALPAAVPAFDVEVRLRASPRVRPGAALAARLLRGGRCWPAGRPRRPRSASSSPTTRELADLNAAHMGQAGPTDVLSFPLLPPEAYPPHEGGPTRPPPVRAPGAPTGASSCRPAARLHLGDIVVSVERAIEQAEAGRGGQTGDVRWSPATSCGSSSSTARSTSAAGTTPSRRRRPRCAPSSGGSWPRRRRRASPAVRGTIGRPRPRRVRGRPREPVSRVSAEAWRGAGGR